MNGGSGFRSGRWCTQCRHGARSGSRQHGALGSEQQQWLDLQLALRVSSIYAGGVNDQDVGEGRA